jgi:hypothetical protein
MIASKVAQSFSVGITADVVIPPRLGATAIIHSKAA